MEVHKNFKAIKQLFPEKKNEFNLLFLSFDMASGKRFTTSQVDSLVQKLEDLLTEIENKEQPLFAIPPFEGNLMNHIDSLDPSVRNPVSRVIEQNKIAQSVSNNIPKDAAIAILGEINRQEDIFFGVDKSEVWKDEFFRIVLTEIKTRKDTSLLAQDINLIANGQVNPAKSIAPWSSIQSYLGQILKVWTIIYPNRIFNSLDLIENLHFWTIYIWFLEDANTQGRSEVKTVANKLAQTQIV